MKTIEQLQDAVTEASTRRDEARDALDNAHTLVYARESDLLDTSTVLGLARNRLAAAVDAPTAAEQDGMS